MTEQPRHNYEYEIELGSDTAPARVVRLAGHKKRILEVGAGPGSITKHLIKNNNCDVVALEIDPMAIAKLRQFCDRIYSLDLNDHKWVDALAAEERFDVVIAADVLEHVLDPLATLRAMAKLLTESGEIILSLPHVGHCVIGACLMDEDFEYRDWGLLDRTHIRFFGLKNMNRLLADAGLSIVEAEFVVRRPQETEFKDRWESLRPDVQAALASNPHGYVYQVVSKSQKMGIAARRVDLMALPVAEAANGGHASAPVDIAASDGADQSASALMKLKVAARKHIPPAAHARLRRIATQIGIVK